MLAAVAALAIGAGSAVAFAAPTLRPLDIYNVTQTGAMIEGSVSSSLVAYYHLEYGPTTSYGTNSPSPDGEKDPYVCPVTTGPWIGCATAAWANAFVDLTLSSLLPGTTYHIRLVANDASGTTYGDDNTFTTLLGPAPVDLTPPTLSGDATLAGTLTCTPGEWSDAPTFTFSWLRNGVAIPAASGDNYGSVEADFGTQIACRVTASEPGHADATAQTPPIRITHEPLRMILLARPSAVSRNGAVRIQIFCFDAFQPCRTSLTLRSGRRHGRRRATVLARARVLLAPGASRRITLTLNHAGRRLLNSAPHHRVTVTATLGKTSQVLELLR